MRERVSSVLTLLPSFKLLLAHSFFFFSFCPLVYLV
uniref:Uncharacterized protein n=1 Tax=Siphoviridae sp. ctDOT22 TaxID=2827812 RepID=A0A8S5SWQ8_9CAUD|nr:MAG TPA: hypothetical protein [Siphoviridae sp. ctDOT22]